MKFFIATFFNCFLILIISVFAVTAQVTPVGSWRMHLPKNRMLALVETQESIIGATEFGLVKFNLDDNSIDKFDKVDGLTGIGISNIAYDAARGQIIVGYADGNLDFVSDGRVTNIPDIFRSRIMGSKRINHIKIHGNRAYLSCDFGIVEVDLVSKLIRNTWFIGPLGSQVRVYALTILDGFFYAATHAGLMRASVTGVNHADFQNWQRIQVSGQANEVINMVVPFDGRLIVNRLLSAGDEIHVFENGQWRQFRPAGMEVGGTRRQIRADNNRLLIANYQQVWVLDRNLDTQEVITSFSDLLVRANDLVVDKNNLLWFADNTYGIVRRNSAASFSKFILPGPATPNSFNLALGNGTLVVATGSITPRGSNLWIHDGVFRFENEQWVWLSRFDFPIMSDAIDIIRIAIDPGNPQAFYAATWTHGLLEFNNGRPSTLWNDQNSPLQRRTDVGDLMRIGGVAVDPDGNVWVTNSHTNRAVAVKRANNQWFSFENQGLIGPNQMVGDITIDQAGNKWIILPNGGGIYVFREKSFQNANDFNGRVLSTAQGSGSLLSLNVHSIAIDHNGFVWVGTDKGVSVFYSTAPILRGEPVNSIPVMVRQDGFAGILFADETVNAITVDGANKKWFGTSRSGAFLLSEDGRNTLMHFTTENSPLPSNNILDIAINGQTGEVFFATDRGIASYRAFATEAAPIHNEVLAYPNPVRAGYDGFISVKGLVRNARVKITDINGNLVFESIAEGGQVVWNGRDLFGRRPASGVYLVFSTNEDGSETFVTKILFLN